MLLKKFRSGSIIKLITLMLSLTLIPSAFASDTSNSTCPLGKAFKVAVFQAGSYGDFQKVFRQTTIALQKKDLIKGPLLDPTFTHDKEGVYERFSKDSQGGCIEFVSDGFYNGLWNSEYTQDLANELKERVKNTQDISMIWALGTVAGQLLADSSLGIPVLVMTPTDPERSGIVGPGEFSDKENVHAQKEVNRYDSELRLFYNIFKFEDLGVIIDSNPDNHAGQAVPVIRNLAHEKRFYLIECQGDIIGDDPKLTQSEFSKCAKYLSSQVDAVYIPMGNGASPTNFYEQIKPLLDHKIPVFSQSGESEVEMGALMALSNSDLQASGEFEANVIEQLVQGKKAHEISEYYYAPLNLCLNLESARLIGYKPDFELLVGVDKVYQTIKRP